MQEYACSMWNKVERQRLNYIESFVQDDIRAASYKGLIDAVHVDEDGEVCCAQENTYDSQSAIPSSGPDL